MNDSKCGKQRVFPNSVKKIECQRNQEENQEGAEKLNKEFAEASSRGICDSYGKPIKNKASSRVPGKKVDYRSKDVRIMMAKMVMRLFQLWQLQPADQLSVLGLSPHSGSSLYRYRSGYPIANRHDLIHRIGLLFSIHKSLSLLFPNQLDLLYRWIMSSNLAFDGRTPLNVLKEGIDGIEKVTSYLDSQLNH